MGKKGRKKPRHGGASKRNRGRRGNPLFGKKLVEVHFSQLPDGAVFSINGEACGELFKKIPPPKRDEGFSFPRNAKRLGYGGRLIHFGVDVVVWTSKGELGKSEIYEEALRRG